MKLIPYLYFSGNCEEALGFYQKIFNAETPKISRYGDAFPVPDDHKNKVLHASLLFGDNVIMVSDTMPGGTVDYGNGIHLSIGLDSEEQGRSIFDQLADGGKIKRPMEKQFWGDLFGEVTDKYGIRWMINC